MNNDNRGNVVFGYLQIQKSELLVREYDAYKAVYCGLCKQMGKDYSFFMRMTLSYDCTFYAMLLMSLSSSCKGFKDGRCTCNPLKKCKFAIDSGEAYRKAAAFSVSPTFCSRERALRSMTSGESSFKSVGARVMFSSTVYWGNRLKF